MSELEKRVKRESVTKKNENKEREEEQALF